MFSFSSLAILRDHGSVWYRNHRSWVSKIIVMWNKIPNNEYLNCIHSISGICAAIQLQKKFGDAISFTIFELNTDVGGTWLNNVYPGNICYSHLIKPSKSYIVSVVDLYKLSSCCPVSGITMIFEKFKSVVSPI